MAKKNLIYNGQDLISVTLYDHIMWKMPTNCNNFARNERYSNLTLEGEYLILNWA